MTVATTAVVAAAFRTSLQPATTAGQAAVVSSPSAAPVKHAPARTSPPSSRTGGRTASPRPTPAPTAVSSVVVAGGVVNTQYGPVQVEITVRGGRITKAHTLQHPSGDGQTDQINGYAVPQLDQETMAAQNGQIDTVSGATFTSEGYRQSLQSALDAAHRAGAR
jgi:uncharacterized protein with FMN-binding domain